MKELIEILDAIDRFAAAREPMALATIVGVRGSTYRRQGARLLLTRSQQMVGNISGGCLEGDVMVVADERALAAVTGLSGAAPGAGRRLAVWADGARIGTLGDATMDDRAARAGTAAIQEGASRIFSLPGSAGAVQAFVEVLRPPIRLVVCGAGHDAVPVVQLAAQMGWRVVVVDSRERFLTRDR